MRRLAIALLCAPQLGWANRNLRVQEVPGTLCRLSPVICKMKKIAAKVVSGDTGRQKPEEEGESEDDTKPLMSRVDLLRTELCWDRHNLNEHLECLEYLGIHCEKESTGKGICKKFRVLVHDGCEGLEDVQDSVLRKKLCEVAGWLHMQTNDTEASITMPSPASVPELAPPALQPPSSAPALATPAPAVPAVAVPAPAAPAEAAPTPAPALPAPAPWVVAPAVPAPVAAASPAPTPVFGPAPAPPAVVPNATPLAVPAAAPAVAPAPMPSAATVAAVPAPAPALAKPEVPAGLAPVVAPQPAPAPTQQPMKLRDSDTDGIPDQNDTDRDNDGVRNKDDMFPLNDNEWKDSNGNGIGDNSDPDRDGDGVPNKEDAFPDDPREWKDSDGDGIGDNSDDYPFNKDCYTKTRPCDSGSLPNKVRKGLPPQGYDEFHPGVRVRHSDDTVTSDWGKERPHSPEAEKKVLDRICEKHPDNPWCQDYRSRRGVET